MEKLRQHHKDQTEVGNDVRAEALISALLELRQLGKEVIFYSNGGFSRNYSKDIKGIIDAYGNQLQLPKSIMELNRKGLYDGLPEGLFHQQEESKPFRSIGEIKSMIKRNREKEDEARKFFWPFDHELTVLSSAIEFNERNQIANVLSTAENRGLKKFWNVPNFLTANEQGKLLMLLPLSHKISSSVTLIQDAFRILFDMKRTDEGKELLTLTKRFVNVSETIPAVSDVESMYLGINSVLGQQIQESVCNLHITIGPIPEKDAAQFAPGQHNAKKLQAIQDYFVPCSFHCTHDILVLEEDRDLKTDNEHSRLGVTSYLN